MVKVTRSKAELLGIDEPSNENKILVQMEDIYERIGDMGSDTFHGFDFARSNEGKLIYIPELKLWREWDGIIWGDCDIKSHIQGYAAAGVDAANRDYMKFDTSEKKAILKTKSALLDSRAQDRAVNASTSWPYVRVPSKMLNSTPHKIGVQNGTLNLNTGQLTKSKPSDYLTRQLEASFVEDAESPKFDSFLNRVLPDAEIRGLLQRAVGYTLFGHANEQVMFFTHGPGASGKSTFANIMESLFGDYSTSLGKELLVKTHHATEHDRNVVQLFGRRMASINETSRGDVFDDQRVKKVTSVDRIPARRLYGENFSFAPTHTTWLRGNYLPGVQDASEAFWRRMVPIHFGVQIPANERDPGIESHILKHEMSGVLAWATRGAVEWRKRGLCIPKTVQDERESYRQSTDIFGQWLDECTKVSLNARTLGSDLFQSYSTFCNASGLGSGIIRTFSEELVRRGFEKRHGNKGIIFTGISLTGGFDDVE